MERVHLNSARPVARHASVTYLPDCVFICINRNEAKILPILRIMKREDVQPALWWPDALFISLKINMQCW